MKVAIKFERNERNTSLLQESKNLKSITETLKKFKESGTISEIKVSEYIAHGMYTENDDNLHFLITQYYPKTL